MMMEIMEDSSSSSSDDDVVLFIERINRPPRKQRIYRTRNDGFTFWDEIEFYQRFRLSKRVANMILQHLRDDITSETNWNHAIEPGHKLLFTLRFMATNNFLISVGDFAGIHKTTAGHYIFDVLKLIVKLKHQYLHFPTDFASTKHEFYKRARFPNVIGALDCTHVKIQSPGGDFGEMYRNRKWYFSFNVQAICNAKLQFTDIVARWPGSVHDARIFNNSRIKERFENGEFGDGILLADSGYALKKYCLVPVLHPRTRREHLYNEAHVRTRNTVERAFGVLKRRFPVLSLGIRLDLDKVQCIIMAAAVLHNIAIEMNEAEAPPPTPAMLRAIRRANNVPVDNNLANGNAGFRIPYLNYFENL